MATDQTPNSLINVRSTVTSKYGTAQILIFTAAGFSIIYLLQFIINHKDNPDVVNYGALTILGIIAAVYIGARSEYALYSSERFLIFNTKQALKTDEIYKYSKKTTSKRARKFTKLISADEEGHLHFEICKTYANNKCNYAFCYTVTPSNPNDMDSFHLGIEQLFNSLPPGCLQKNVIAQSKDLTDLAAVYAKKLEKKGLPVFVRMGLRAKMKFFEQVKDRVGWMYVLFVGVGYFTDEEDAHERIDEIRDSYSKMLRIHGIKVNPVLDAEEYAILYAQMFTMKNLQGLM